MDRMDALYTRDEGKTGGNAKQIGFVGWDNFTCGSAMVYL